MRNRNLKKAWLVLTTAIILLQLAVSAHASYRIEYEYDSLDRLVKVTHPNGESVFYTYDAVGNRTSKVVSTQAAPTMVASILENGQTQRSSIKTISVEFSEDVTITSDALSITGQSHGPVDLIGAVFDYDSLTYTATWTLPQSLPDDQYTATLDASKITNSAAKNLDGNGDGIGGDNATFTFYRLFGDTTGNAEVNGEDLDVFVDKWLSNPDATGLDADGDDFVNFIDFAAFAKNWAASFSPPSSSLYPTVVAHVIASGQTQRSTVKDIGVQFSRTVTVASDALAITGQTTGTVNIASAGFNYNPGSLTATWTFSDSLPDDEFTTTIAAAKVIDSQGYRLDGNNDGIMGDDYTFNLHRLFGDSTGDAKVDFEDLLILSSHWLNEPVDTGLDIDNSNTINFVDFTSFANNWLKNIVP